MILLKEQLEAILRTGLALCPIKVNEEYLKEWNEQKSDFVVLTMNSQWINNCLYRVGGLNSPNPKEDKYFILIKYVEAYYPKHITQACKSKSPKHLEGRWCIIDNNGVERKVFEPFKIPYLVNKGPIYSVDSNYYNIETGEHYGWANGFMKSNEYLFLDMTFDKNRQGIMKLNINDGSYELFK